MKLPTIIADDSGGCKSIAHFQCPFPVTMAQSQRESWSG
jgi:hypothetical protein